MSSGSSISAPHRRSSSLYSLGPPELGGKGQAGGGGGGGAQLSAGQQTVGGTGTGTGTGTGAGLPQRRESLSPPSYGGPSALLAINDSKRHVLFDSEWERVCVCVEGRAPPRRVHLLSSMGSRDVHEIMLLLSFPALPHYHHVLHTALVCCFMSPQGYM